MVWSCADRVHGGIDLDELQAHGVTRRILDFSVNLNPYGPCEAVLAAMRAAPLDVYPDASARLARSAWADQLDVSIDRIAVAHGAAELFWSIARTLLPPAARVVIAEPTFSEFRIAAESCGATLQRVWASEASGFRFDMAALRSQARDAHALYLCSPNNPTGHHLDLAEVVSLSRALPETLIVLDQSFLSLSDQASELGTKMPENVIAVRSLTKDFCLPGLRIALLSAPRELVTRIERARPTWSTSAPAQAAIAEAARQQGFVAESYRKMRANREQVRAVLVERGLSPLASDSTFQLVRVGEGAAFRERLLKQGVLVRDCASFGLPGYVRIAARPEDEIRQLAAALAL